MTMRASLIITAKDQASTSFRRIAQSAKRMGEAFRPVRSSADDASRSIARVGQNSWSRFARIGAAAKKMAGDMRIAERAAYGLGYAIGSTARKGAGLALGAAKWGLAGAAGAAGLGIGKLVTDTFSIGMQFEQFQAQLEGTEGSARKAKAALDWVAKFAAQTPYEIDQVTDAFVRARGVGINPFAGAMRDMGDAAAANRKTLMDSVEAIADAQTGEFERLKAFNITTSVKGNIVAFSYLDKAGKNAVKSTRKNAADIQKTILSIWEERHAGAMIRQSKTMAGLIANLTDQWKLFALKVAGKGVFDTVKNALADLLDWVNRLADNGTLDRWAQRISDNLKSMWEWGTRFFKETDWNKVGSDFERIARAAWVAAKGFAWLVEKVSAVPWLADRLVSEPLFQVKSGGASGPSAGAKPTGAKDPWWKILSIEHAPAKVTVPAKALPSGRPTASAKPLAGNVKVDVNVKASGGAQVQSTRVSSNDRRVQPSVRTGRAMAEAA